MNRDVQDSGSPIDGDPPLLKLERITKRYPGVLALDQVDFDLRPGEVHVLFGENGAGKSTIISIVAGALRQDGGRIEFRGQPIDLASVHHARSLGISAVFQEFSLVPQLTVEQNLLAILETMRRMNGRERRARARELIDQFGLSQQKGQEARTLSGGERRKLEIARALVTEPTLIMLDEPFSGVDPIAVEELQTEIVRLRSESGIAILLTDHNVRETLAVTDRSYIISDGKELRSGPPSELVRDPLVRKTYLGSTFQGNEFDAPAR